MWVIPAFGLFVCAAAWRVTHFAPFGRLIVKALGSENENLCSIAGILLVKAGRLAEPLLEESLHKRENLATVLPILADIGDRGVESEIQGFSRDADPRIAEAARQALRVLAMQR